MFFRITNIVDIIDPNPPNPILWGGFSNYKQKYLKYKAKYLALKKLQ